MSSDVPRGRPPPPNVDDMITLKVDNVPHRATAEEVREVFCRFGDVGDVYIPRDHYTQDSRGFAFVRFLEKRDAEDAAEEMNNYNFQGRELRVQFAQRRRPGNPREHYSRREDDRRDDRDRDRDRGRDRDSRYGDDRREDRWRDRYDDRDRGERRSRDRRDSRDYDDRRGRDRRDSRDYDDRDRRRDDDYRR